MGLNEPIQISSVNQEWGIRVRADLHIGQLSGKDQSEDLFLAGAEITRSLGAAQQTDGCV